MQIQDLALALGIPIPGNQGSPSGETGFDALLQDTLAPPGGPPPICDTSSQTGEFPIQLPNAGSNEMDPASENQILAQLLAIQSAPVTSNAPQVETPVAKPAEAPKAICVEPLETAIQTVPAVAETPKGKPEVQALSQELGVTGVVVSQQAATTVPTSQPNNVSKQGPLSKVGFTTPGAESDTPTPSELTSSKSEGPKPEAAKPEVSSSPLQEASPVQAKADANPLSKAHAPEFVRAEQGTTNIEGIEQDGSAKSEEPLKVKKSAQPSEEPARSVSAESSTPMRPSTPEHGSDHRQGSSHAHEQLKELADSIAIKLQREVLIDLEPESLGPMQIKVSQTGQEVAATIHAANPLVVKQISDHHGELQNRFAEAGLSMSSFDVSSGSRQSGQAPTPMTQPVTYRHSDRKAPTTPTSPRRTSVSGVDLWI